MECFPVFLGTSYRFLILITSVFDFDRVSMCVMSEVLNEGKGKKNEITHCTTFFAIVENMYYAVQWCDSLTAT